MLRIISGQWKGLQLVAPVGDATRPTTDRVKESMFNLMGLSWTGHTAVDLFAGSGALGLETLSRGADEVIFVDKNPKSLHAIGDNIRRCKAEPWVQVWKMDWLAAWKQVVAQGVAVGWVFVDPPYRMMLWDKVLETIGCGEHPVTFGVVCEHPKTTMLPDTVGHLHLHKSKCYGDIQITMYRYNDAERGDT
jgi:16S rRNA (guanine966-N2)-methyltransferase